MHLTMIISDESKAHATFNAIQKENERKCLRDITWCKEEETNYKHNTRK